MTAAEAVQQAEAEGLTLLESDNSSGYKGVSFNGKRNVTKSYHAKLKRGGKSVSLGYFATAEEAALCYARSPEAQVAVAAAAAAAPLAPPPMTAGHLDYWRTRCSDQALAQAEAEGLTLLRSSDSCTGFRGVSVAGADSNNRNRPYQPHMWRGGTQVPLGSFATAEEAALLVARAFYAAQAPPPTPPAASSRKRKAEPEEELEDAKEDDVEVVVLDAYELFQPVAMGAEHTHEDSVVVLDAYEV